MSESLEYLNYLYNHKKQVYKSGRELGAPRLQLLKHDLSKLYPSSFKVYKKYFFGPEGKYKTNFATAPPELEQQFRKEVEKHYNREKHHLHKRSIPTAMKDIPLNTRKEMLADWHAVSKVMGYQNDIHKFIEDKQLHHMLKSAQSSHDLIFYSNRSTPQIVAHGAEAKPKQGYGKMTSRRQATTDEERFIATGKWLRVDERGNKPTSEEYKKTKYRPQLVKKAATRKEKATAAGLAGSTLGLGVALKTYKEIPRFSFKHQILPILLGAGALGTAGALLPIESQLKKIKEAPLPNTVKYQLLKQESARLETELKKGL